MNAASEPVRLYYIAAYSHVPCDCTLAGWAAWLAKPDEEWGRDQPATDGDRFVSSVMRFEPDIIAKRGADGWSFSRDLAAADFLAVRFGEGLGWDADNIVSTDELSHWFGENDSFCDGVEYIAVGMNEPDVMLTFHAGPPASMSVDSVQ